MERIKRALRRVLPQSALDRYRRARYGRTWFDVDDRSTQEVFTDIYRRGIWGQATEPFYSGPGSDASVIAPYLMAIRAFIDERRIVSIVDLGCGDFRVGAQLVGPGISYHGIDIVPALIARNRAKFSGPNIAFSCVDATSAELPAAQLCLIREVLQHLSNDEIARVLQRCRGFRYVVVTDCMADAGHFTAPNIDIVHGPNTRADIGSGLVLDAPPFSERVAGVLLESPGIGNSTLRSVLIENP